MKVIQGNVYKDERGAVRFVNDFDMAAIKRMYSTEPKLGIIRAWQGHKKETKWFYVAKGRFVVKTINIQNFDKKEYLLSESESEVLEIQCGHYNGFEALQKGSVLMVFSDLGLEDSKSDDFRESLDNINW